MAVVRRAFLIQVELDVAPETTVQDVALMVDDKFDDRHPADFEGDRGCKVYEVMEARA
jgi:hypothetical protein